MKQCNKIFICTVIFLFGGMWQASAHITFKAGTSAIQLDGGTEFVLGKEIVDCGGRIIKNADAVISGSTITFNRGTLQDNGNSTVLSSLYTPGSDNKITLNGNGKFRGVDGTVLQVVHVSGNNNRLEGSVGLSDALVLLDASASVTCAFSRKLGQNIILNGGTLCLDDDLSFIDDKKLVGSGVVIGNGRRLNFGASDLWMSAPMLLQDGVNLNLRAGMSLASTWTCAGSYNIIQGNGNTLDMTSSGKIFVASGSTLYFENIVIHGLSGKNIECEDDSAALHFHNVSLIQTGDVTFDTGSFCVCDWLDITGSHTFTYQPIITSTISANSVLMCDKNLTFSYAPQIPNKNLLAMENASSTLHLKDMTLYTTATGLALTKGKVIIDGTVVLQPATDGVTAEGVAFGDNTVEGDCLLEVYPNGMMRLDTGYLIYNNVLPASCKMDGNLATLRLQAGTKLYLNQNMTLHPGRLQMHQASAIVPANFSVDLNAWTDIFG